MAKRLSFYSLMTATALLFSYVEQLFPLDFIAPGMRLGLANIVPLFLLCYGKSEAAFFVNAVRIGLASLLFTGFLSLVFSLAGGLLSFAGMVLLFKTKRFGPVGISAAAGTLHNIGQLIVAILMMGGPVVYYLPFLIIAGTLSGSLTGFGAGLLNKRIKNLELR